MQVAAAIVNMCCDNSRTCAAMLEAGCVDALICVLTAGASLYSSRLVASFPQSCELEPTNGRFSPWREESCKFPYTGVIAHIPEGRSRKRSKVFVKRRSGPSPDPLRGIHSAICEGLYFGKVRCVV